MPLFQCKCLFWPLQQMWQPHRQNWSKNCSRQSMSWSSTVSLTGVLNLNENFRYHFQTSVPKIEVDPMSLIFVVPLKTSSQLIEHCFSLSRKNCLSFLTYFDPFCASPYLPGFSRLSSLFRVSKVS